MPRAAGAATLAEFDQRAAKATAGQEKDAALTHALLMQRAHMMSILDSFMAMVEQYLIFGKSLFS